MVPEDTGTIAPELRGNDMNVDELLAKSRDALTVGRVFGEPIERDGVTIIPVARVAGAGGGGAGGGGKGEDRADGSGSGYAMSVQPAGVYVVRDGQVTWQPAVNVNRIVAGGQAVAVALFLVIWAIVRARSKAASGPQEVLPIPASTLPAPRPIRR
jgi:uncharacterized spore protein YtfJ